jgi:beta-lactam-binding protein with PASTA domain/tRNA A-37 threonylcarbamoyl transferase component Bud32
VATTLNDQIGRVLGGRYRLIAPIGRGASAQVYLADDTTLRRRVAVKILHQGLATDETFLRRFRAEAQAAAAMNHPHILAVYDWGEDDVPYLVSEYLGGGSLRSMLDAGHLLSVSQALLVGLEAARGLEYAHRQKIVHRDIKPANLLFDDEARLRIADFGIARALAEAGWTEQGTVVGTARYASPEQAKSDPLTGKSDVYALGLVLIESVTGEVPFRGDTPISTLVARIDQQVPVPKEMGPLRRVLERAGDPDPEERPDAGEFIIGLMAAAEECARPEPLPLVGALPKEPGGADDTGDRTEVNVAPVLAPPAPVTTAKPTTPEPTRVFERVERTPAARDIPPPVPFHGDDDDDHHRRRWPWVLLVLLVVLGAVGGGVAAYLANRTVSHDVPELRDATVEELQLLAEENDWILRPNEEYSPDIAQGRIVRTEPVAGTSLEEGGELKYWTSAGPEPITIPPLAGLTVEQANTALQDAGLTMQVPPETAYDETVPVDQIIRIGTENPTALPGEAIPVVVSLGPAPRVIPPELVGQPQAAVEAKLTELGLTFVPVPAFSDTVAAGSIIGFKTGDGTADIVPGTTEVPKGAQVQIIVSQGRAPVKIPDVRDKTAPAAIEQLRNLGFIVEIDGDATKRVLETDPRVGTEVPYGSTITLVMR